jgi:hypothetical protein
MASGHHKLRSAITKYKFDSLAYDIALNPSVLLWRIIQHNNDIREKCMSKVQRWRDGKNFCGLDRTCTNSRLI